MKDPYKARGRTAHEGHLCKTGQAWKEDYVQVFVEDPMSHEYRLFDMPRGSRSCQLCGEIIRYDERGYAFCSCMIWNEAKPRLDSQLAKMIKLDKFKRFCKA